MSERDGGPAFPARERYCEVNHKWEKVGTTGMTLRDWFAGQALVAMTTSPHLDYNMDDGAKMLAEDAYLVADAMLAAREQEK